MLQRKFWLNDAAQKLHTHWSFTPANPQPKMPKEYAIATTVQSMFYNNLQRIIVHAASSAINENKL